MFRVGQADETLPRRGLTHLVEHLVLSSSLGEGGVQGQVDLLTTMMLFEGEPAKVATRLAEAVTALASPPTDRLEVERRILSVEDGPAGPEGVLLALLYGARGPGLASYAELGLRSARPEDVAGHAARWFGRGNAALVLVGDVAGDIELPPGPRMPAPAPVPLAIRTPAEIARPDSPLALGAQLPDHAESAVLTRLLERRTWKALRHDQGLAYDVRCRLRSVGPDERLLALVTDVETSDASAGARAMVEQVQQLAAGEMSAGEVEEAAASIEQAALEADPLHLLTVVATSELVRGRVTLPEETIRQLRAVTRDGVVDAAAMLAERMVLACPEGATSGLLPAFDPSADPPLTGRRFRRRLAPRHLVAAEVIVAEQGVSAVFGEGEAVTVRFASCAAAVRGLDGALTLVDESGEMVTLDPGDLRDGREAVAEAEARLDPAVVVELDERDARVQASVGRGLRAAIVGEAPELLGPLLGRDERLLHTAEATQGVRSGVLAVTDRRLLFVAKLLSEHVEEIPLAAIKRVRRRRNPLWPQLTVEHGKGTSKFSFMTIPRLNEAAEAVGSALQS